MQCLRLIGAGALTGFECGRCRRVVDPGMHRYTGLLTFP